MITAGTYNAIHQFTTGDTVTCIVYDLTTGSTVATNTNQCSEVGTTGLFVWNAQNLTTAPTGYKEYGFMMNNGTTDKGGKFSMFNSEDTTRLEEIWKILGLDLTAPMTVTESERTAGSITQVITGDGTTTSTVTRQ